MFFCLVSCLCFVFFTSRGYVVAHGTVILLANPVTTIRVILCRALVWDSEILFSSTSN